MIILSSYGFYYITIRNQLKELFSDKSGKMLIIPLASAYGMKYGIREKESAIDAGFLQENIFVFDEKNPDMFLEMKFDYIVIIGGNTFRLLQKVRMYGLDTFIKEQVENGADYIGISAGAYLACTDIEYVKNFDDNNFITDGDFSGLALTDKYILCHFDERGTAEIKMCRQFIGYDTELITINDNQIVIL